MSEPTVTIPKTDLPECQVVMIDGEAHVDCGSDWGTWAVKHVGRMRETALEYVAAWLVAEEWTSKQAVLARKRESRRDELATEFTAVNSYNGQLPYTQKLIDRIIELENHK